MSRNNFKIHYSPDEIDHRHWEILLCGATGNFFQTHEALQFFKELDIETFFLALESGNELKALVIGIIQKEGGVLKSFFSRRAIIYGGPLLKENILPVEIDAFLSVIKDKLRKKAIYIETRNLSDYSRFKAYFTESGINYNPHFNFHVDCRDETLIKKGVSKSKLRQVNKSLQSGAEITEAGSLHEVKEFYTILKNLYRTKIKIPLFPEEFFIDFFKKDLGKYLLVKFKNKVIGGIMCPIFHDRLIYEWYICGEDGKYRGIYPSVLATWAAIQYANKHGIEKFDFMGAGRPGKDYGVREFKSKFGGEQVEYGRFLFIIRPLLYNIGKIGVKVLGWVRKVTRW